MKTIEETIKYIEDLMKWYRDYIDNPQPKHMLKLQSRQDSIRDFATIQTILDWIKEKDN